VFDAPERAAADGGDQLADELYISIRTVRSRLDRSGIRPTIAAAGLTRVALQAGLV
jgi:hypothetical protein